MYGKKGKKEVSYLLVVDEAPLFTCLLQIFI